MKLLRWLALSGAAGAGWWLYRYLQPKRSTLMLNGSVVVVTGASSGIGRALVDVFARQGANVVLAARSAETLSLVEHQIAPYASDVLVIPTDITQEQQCQALIQQTLDHFGRIDILVNNAGLLQRGPLHASSAEDVQQIINTNLTAAIQLTRLVLPIMLAQQSGKIVNVSSIAGEAFLPQSVIYSASKHGLNGFSKSLRRELRGTGVEVMTVLPTYTRTNMLSSNPPFELDTPEYVAERTVNALLENRDTLVFGGPLIEAYILLERVFPLVGELYWQAVISPNYIHRLLNE